MKAVFNFVSEKISAFVAVALVSSFALAAPLSKPTEPTRPAISCNIEAFKARQMVLDDGTVTDEGVFRDQALRASYACEMAAINLNWKTARATVQQARRACDEASSGQSNLYRGTCHLRAAELLTFILGQ